MPACPRRCRAPFPWTRGYRGGYSAGRGTAEGCADLARPRTPVFQRACAQGCRRAGADSRRCREGTDAGNIPLPASLPAMPARGRRAGPGRAWRRRHFCCTAPRPRTVCPRKRRRLRPSASRRHTEGSLFWGTPPPPWSCRNPLRQPRSSAGSPPLARAAHSRADGRRWVSASRASPLFVWWFHYNTGAQPDYCPNG